MKKKWVILFLCGFVMLPQQAWCQAEEFIDQYLAVLELVRITEVRKEQLQDQVRMDRNYTDIQLSLLPELSFLDYQFPGNVAFDQTTFDLGSTVRANLPSGTELLFRHQLSIADRSDELDNQENTFTSLNLKQSLYRNFFGKQYKLAAKLTENIGTRQINASKGEVLRGCHQAYEKYNQWMYSSNRQAIYHEILQHSHSIFKDAQNKYKQKVMNDLEYQQIKINYLQSENDKVREDHRLANIQTEIYAYKPDTHKNQTLWLGLPDLEKSIAQKNLAELVMFYSLQNQQVKQNNGWDVLLGGSIGRNKRKNDYSFSVEGDNTRDQYGVNLELQVPLYQTKNRRDQWNTQYQKEMAELELDALQKKLSIEQQVFMETLAQVQIQQQRLQDQNEDFQKLNNLAYRRFSKRKIRFDQYQDIQNQYAFHRLAQIELMFQYNQQILNWANMIQSPVDYCKKWVL
ncbi:MAG: hypothetical protein R3A45_07885 [Bdellovibrionota bacterium]